MGAAEDNWLCETRVARPDEDEAPTVDMRRAPRARRRPTGTAVMLRPLGLAPMQPRAAAGPPPSMPSPPDAPPASCRRPKIVMNDTSEVRATATTRPSYERRAVWVVSALLVVVFAWRAVPIAAARLSDVAAKLSTPSDP